MYFISPRHLRADGARGHGPRSPRRGLLVREEGGPHDAEAGRDLVPRGCREGARGHEDGGPAPRERARSEGTRRALLRRGGPRAAAGVLPPGPGPDPPLPEADT